jgi:hypothetical protein
MDQAEGGSRSVSLLATLLIAAALCPALYVLSSGPALFISLKTGSSAAYRNAAYKPLTYARDVIPGFHPAFQAYLDFWTE